MEMVTMKPNSKLKAAIHERGTTTTALAKELGIPRTYISMALSGRMNLQPSEMARIAEALGKEIHEVFPQGE
jgi:transcriptional regulator with XRE-family HTH domain